MVGTSEAHAAIDAGLPLYRQHPGYIQGWSPEAQFWRTRIGPVMRLQKIYICTVYATKLTDYGLTLALSLPRAMVVRAIATQAGIKPVPSGSGRTESSA